jgi:hypothetical protein
MVVILFLASALYLAHLNQISFWEDESWMAIALQGDLAHVWHFATERGVHPPLYFYLGWFYTRFVGDSEFTLRWLAGLWALAGIAWTYRLGATWFGRRAGVYAALFAAGSLFLIYFGRLARHYSLFFALAAALVYVYQREWQTAKADKPVFKAFWMTALLQAALLYTHYFGIWMAVVTGLHGLLTLPRRYALRLLAALVLSGVVFLPWLPSLVSQFSASDRGLGYVNPDIGLNLRAYGDRLFNGDYALGFGLVALGLAALWAQRRNGANPATKSIALLLSLWLTLPLLLSLLINTRFAWFIERNMIFTLSGAYALFGAGLAWVSRFRLGKAAAPLAALIFLALGLTRYDTFWPFITPDWRDLAGAMAQDARPEDTYVLNGEPYSLAYYLERKLNTSIESVPLKTWISAPTPAERIWLIDANWAVQTSARETLPPDAQMTRQIVLGVLAAEFYQRVPSEISAVFGDQIAFGSRLPEMLETTPGEVLTFDLWWRAVRTPDTDYSVGVYLLDSAGNIVAQNDGGFDQGRFPAYSLPLDRWTPDARRLMIPAGLPAGKYVLTVAVYNWRDNQRLQPEQGRPDNSFQISEVEVQ